MIRSAAYPVAAVALLILLGFSDPLYAESDEKVWKQIEMVRMWKLAEVLDLKEADMTKIVPVIQEYNGEMRTRARERESLLKDMQRQSAPGQSVSKDLSADVKRVLQIESEMGDLRQKHYQKMQKLLTTDRLVRYMVFEDRFHEEIRDFMNDMTHRHGKRGLFPTPDSAEKKDQKR